MWMMFRVIPIMWRAVRPSRVVDMPAVVNTFWLPKGYEGLTFFGQILAPTQAEADRFNSGYTSLKNHEMIHLRQAQACGDSWLRFYLLYIWYWLKNKIVLLRKRYRPCRLKNAAYLLNPFEIEAYGKMHDLGYPNGPATEWRRYAKMPIKERMKLYNHRL
jgi:hypothetical protein